MQYRRSTLRFPRSTRRRSPWPGLLLAAAGLLACGPTEAAAPDEGLAGDPTPYATRVSDLVSSTCSTATVRGLSEQLLAEVECLRPGTLVPLAGRSGLSLGDRVTPWLQTSAAAALSRAATSGTLELTTATRSLAQAYLIRRWYETGRCGITSAAKPGQSIHESGLAVDVSNYSTRRAALQAEGFTWYGASDPVHFELASGGTDVRTLSVQAFQRLWNRNHAADRITEDGVYGPQTASRLGKAPVNGFAAGASCAAPPAPDPEDTGDLLASDFWNTYYYFASEADYGGVDDTWLYDDDCQAIAKVPKGFSDDVCIEGSGRLADGRVISYASTCTTSCTAAPRCWYGSQPRICYSVMDPAEFPWGRGARGTAIVPLRTWAVDTDVIALGTPLYAAEWDGVAIPAVDGLGGFVHDGCFRADDVGSAIDGHHYDFFAGTDGMWRALEQLFPTHSTFTVFSDAGRCAYLDD